MQEIFLISKFDFEKYGCPHCSSFDGDKFFCWKDNRCCIWICQSCDDSFIIVQKDELDITSFCFKDDTNILNLIDKHPHRFNSMSRQLKAGCVHYS